MNFSQISFGLLSIKFYGIAIAVAFLMSIWRYYKTIQRKEFPTNFFVHNFWKWTIAGVGMGRIVSVITTPGIWERNGIFAPFAFWDGEINFFGALIGFLLLMRYDLKKQKLNYLRWLDAGILPFLFAILIADIAGFITGEIYGKETILPWGVQYETISVDILSPTHPVALYAFLMHIILYQWARKRMYLLDKVPGKLALRAGIFFFLIDFIVQFFRADTSFYIANFLRIEQVFDLALLVFLFVWGHWQKVAEK